VRDSTSDTVEYENAVPTMAVSCSSLGRIEEADADCHAGHRGAVPTCFCYHRLSSPNLPFVPHAAAYLLSLFIIRHLSLICDISQLLVSASFILIFARIAMERRRISIKVLLPLTSFLTLVAFLWASGINRQISEFRGRPSGFGNGVEKAQSDFKAPKRSVWADLTKDEADEVYDFLAKEWAELNLTRSPTSAFDNFIYTVETLKPNKTDASPYLQGDGTIPARWAKVVLSHYQDGEALLIYHAVGPLPVSNKTTVTPLEFPFTDGRHSVRNMMVDFVGSMQFGANLLDSISDITEELLGARFNKDNPMDPDSLVSFGRLEPQKNGEMLLWSQAFRPGMGSSGRTLLPQGLYIQVNATGPASEWTAGQVYYNGKLHKSLETFREAMRSPDFLKTPPNRDGSWTATEDFDARPLGREKPPPVSIQPHGARYRVDREEKFVSWFDFDFYFTSTQATGISLHDVRFQGRTVLYELSLQEALAHYAGDDPMAGGQEFLDSFFGMGTNAFQLVPGYDCPAYADFFSTELHRSGKTETLVNNICLFEFTADYPLSRHTAQHSVTVSRNTFLTLRSISTVGNYDYDIDYIFYLDGTIEVKVRIAALPRLDLSSSN